MTIGEVELRRAFPSRPPSHITQEPFDSGPKHLAALARLHPGNRAQPSDLWEYTQDLLYCAEIQGPLLTFLLPYCLEAWRDIAAWQRHPIGSTIPRYLSIILGKN